MQCKRGPNNTNLCKNAKGQWRFRSRTNSSLTGATTSRSKKKTRKPGTKRTMSGVAGARPKKGAFVRRSKEKFKTAASAWNDVAKTTGLTRQQVATKNTESFWQWEVI